MATGFATTLNSAFLPTPALGLGTPGLFTYNVAPGGTGASFAPTGGVVSNTNWSLWTVNANTIVPAGPLGYTGGATGTVVFGGNVVITGNLNTAGTTGNYINYTQVLMLNTGSGPLAGTTGGAGDKVLLQYGATGAAGTVGYPISLGNSGTTIYQSVPAGGNLAAFIGGTGVMNLTTQSVSIGLAALGGFVGATGTVAIGLSTAAGTQSTTIGVSGGYTGAVNAVALGWGAGLLGGTGSVAIGTSAGAAGANSVAIGTNAGAATQGSGAIALGLSAGQAGQGANAVSLGSLAGQTNQAVSTVAMGYAAGAFAQGIAGVAFGQNAAQTSQGAYAVALGTQAGAPTQVTGTVAVGYQSGGYSGASNISIGYQAGYTGVTGFTGATGGISIGYQAGYIAGGNPYSIALGPQAGYFNQGASAIAIGYQAAGHTGLTGYTGTTFLSGYTGGQGTSSIAIGTQAGYQNDANIQLYTAAYTPNLFGVTGAAGTFGPYNGQAGTYGVGLSANGSTIVAPVYGQPNYYLSTNAGASFSFITTTVTANYNFSACFLSQAGTNALMLTNNATSANVYYTYAANTLTPSWTAIALSAASGATNGSLSAGTTSTLGYILIAVGNSLLVGTTSGVYWGYSATPTSALPAFTTLTTDHGLPSSTAGAWCQTAMSSASSPNTYAVLTYSNASAGTSSTANSYLYWTAWANTTTAASGVSFAIMSGTGLPASFVGTSLYWSAAAFSTTAQYLLVGTSNGILYLSSNGNASSAANVTFSQVSVSMPIVPSTPIAAGGLWAGMSSSGQYMCVGNSSSILMVSYNYGAGWSFLPVYGMLYAARPVMSANGNVIVYATGNTSITGSYYTPMVVYTLTGGTAPNTIAIGTGAGILNQGGNAVAIGTNSGQYSQGTGAIAIGNNAGQSNQSVNSIAIGTNAASRNDALIPSVTTASFTTNLNDSGVTYSASLTYAPTGGGISQNGQYITIGTYAPSTNNIAVSTSGGTLTNASVQPAVTASLVLMSANGIYQLTLPWTSNTTYWYSSNGTAGAAITFTQIPPNLTGGISGSVVYGTCGAMSSTGQYIIIGNSYGLTSSPTNYLYYTINGGTVTLPSFSLLGASNGVPAASVTNYWSTASMSSNAQYIIIPFCNASNVSTGIASSHNLYYSTNGGALSNPSTITFTPLLNYTSNGLPQAPSNSNYYWFRGSAMSSNGQYILVVVGPNFSSYPIGGVAYLSSNGGSLSTPATLVFSQITFPNNLSSYYFTSCSMSNSGQYMLVSGYFLTTFYVSYNYGLNWTALTMAYTFTSFANLMSGDGSKILFPGNGTYNAILIYTLTSSNTNTTINSNVNNNNGYSIAIGNQAGSVNQGIYSIAVGAYAGAYYQAAGYAAASYAGSIAIGNQAGQYSQGIGAIAIGYAAGQTSQPAGSFYIATGSIRNVTNTYLQYSIATGEVFYNTSKTFVIHHPTDPEAYLVHACLEGPEAGVFYRGIVVSVDKATVIHLPDYVRTFAVDFTVLVHAIGSASVYSVSPVVDGTFTVYGPPGEFAWRVIGKRNDIDIEPFRDDIVVYGDGPYTTAFSEKAVPQKRGPVHNQHSWCQA